MIGLQPNNPDDDGDDDDDDDDDDDARFLYKRQLLPKYTVIVKFCYLKVSQVFKLSISGPACS